MFAKMYRQSPYPLRVLAASTRGFILRNQRYGPESEAQVTQTLQRDSWNDAQWHDWIDERLLSVLERAFTHVPYYRDLWFKRRLHGENLDWTRLGNWPVLHKEALRANPEAFLADDVDVSRMIEEHTSGTSGTPLRLWRSRATEREWYSLFEARVRRWHGVSRTDRWAILGGQMVTPTAQIKPPFWVWNAGLSQLYLSTFHISLQACQAYMAALRKYRIVYLLGYPSGLGLLAQMALELNLKTPTMRVVFTNAEVLLPAQRETISRAFGCKVVDTYGMSEISAAGSECQYGAMHLWPEAGIVEVLAEENDRPLPVGNSGRLVCTGLLNSDMPLIRYEVGDRGAISTQSHCACGRGLPILDPIEGRIDDVLVGQDGRQYGRLGSIFKSDLDVREAQIMQEKLGTIQVRIVPGSRYSERTAKAIKQRVIERLGDVQVEIEILDRIPRGANGKFKYVVNRINHQPAAPVENPDD